MDANSDIDEEWFYDSREEVSSVSDLGSDSSVGFLSSERHSCALGYESWCKTPDAVTERRSKFMKWMGLSSDGRRICEGKEDAWHEEKKGATERLRDAGGSMLANLDSKPQFSSSCSVHSFWSCDDTFLAEDGSLEENLTRRTMSLDNGNEFIQDEFPGNVSNSTFHEMGLDDRLSMDEFQKTRGSSSQAQRLLGKDSNGYTIVDVRKKGKSNWLRKFGALTLLPGRAKKPFDSNEVNLKTKSSAQRVHVHVFKKQSKELSSLYAGQQFPAHEGSILSMKFSPDGQYLASAGKDGVVRVWKVLEDEITNKFDIPSANPSSLYVTVNNFSKLVPLGVSKERSIKTKIFSKSVDSACVILPHKIFQLLEKPLHEFHGHEGEVLALSWSKNGYLLSSSVDKTSRLWRLEHDQCLGVFLHNNYVTCAEFNPMDDNYFVSGSIDGKIRIWEVQSCRVIDWIDIQEIITAVCYSPDGKGGIVGTMDGNCRFYGIIDTRLELGAQICLKGKKLSENRITGFQFSPLDASEVVITSADSQVRILCGTDIICKFKGKRSSGNQLSGSFTSDGKHVVSATEDSSVHVWDYNSMDNKSDRPKNSVSRERFCSHNASVAIPWYGFKDRLGTLPGSILRDGPFDEKFLHKLPASCPDCLSMRLGFFLDALYRGSATWPEEKLLKSRLAVVKSTFSKSEFKFLKNTWLSALNNTPHLWGLVIVTAGWDGCIRTFLNYGLPIRF